ncbi:MAG: hypothetical protein AABX37_00410, partial [Nanoarchaeota archaeon]
MAVSDELFTYQATQINPFTGQVLPDKKTTTVAKLEKASAEQNKVIGIVSTSPWRIMGGDIRDQGTNPKPIAMSGRTSVRVSTENGAIVPGDFLTLSSTPGVAMKATKAGTIIGQAMSGYSGEEVGKVVAFVKTTFSQGTKIADLVPGLTPISEADPSPEESLGKLVLEHLVSKKNSLALGDLSEITTDRLVAGLEVITPRVVAGEINIDTIKSATGSTVALELSADGKFVVKDEDGEENITFDSHGNAFFAGTITVDKIKANRVEGIEILTDKISSLEGLVAGVATGSAEFATEPGGLSLTPLESSVSVRDLEGLVSEVKSLSSKVDLLTSTASISAFLAERSNFSDSDSLAIKDATISGKLSVLGRSLFSDVGITGNLNIGVIAING